MAIGVVRVDHDDVAVVEALIDEVGSGGDSVVEDIYAEVVTMAVVEGVGDKDDDAAEVVVGGLDDASSLEEEVVEVGLIRMVFVLTLVTTVVVYSPD